MDNLTRNEVEEIFDKYLITSTEALEILKMSRPALHKMVLSGRITPFKKFPRETLYWRADVLKYAKEKYRH